MTRERHRRGALRAPTYLPGAEKEEGARRAPLRNYPGPIAIMRSPAVSETGDPLLLTPGPLTTSRSVKAAMLHDWGSRDAGFIAMNRSVLDAIVAIAGGA